MSFSLDNMLINYIRFLDKIEPTIRIEHIVQKHGKNSTDASATKFLTSKIFKIEKIIAEALLREPSSISFIDDKEVRIIKMDKKIGTNLIGQKTDTLIVVIGLIDGTLITAYPVDQKRGSNITLGDFPITFKDRKNGKSK